MMCSGWFGVCAAPRDEPLGRRRQHDHSQGDASRCRNGRQLWYCASANSCNHRLDHRDEPEQARAHERVGALGAAGLSLHSFIDGLGIGLAFQQVFGEFNPR